LEIVAGTAPAVDITVYGEIIDPDLRGFIHDPTIFTQMEDIDTTQQEAHKATQIGNVVPRISTNMNDLVSDVSKIALGAAKAELISAMPVLAAVATGMSVGPNLQTVCPMNLRQPRQFQAKDCPNSQTMAPFADAAVSKDFRYVNSRPNEMEIVEYCSRPGLIYVGAITSLNFTDSIVFRRQISPEYMWSTNDASPNPLITGYQGTPMQFIARYFQKWRGSLKFHISFIASPFHSGRFQLSYCPYLTTNPLTTVNSPHNMNIVMDLNEETEYSFTIPYMQDTDWLDIDRDSVLVHTNPSLARRYTNGEIILRVVNQLSAGQPSFNPIYYQIFVSAGEDLQFSNPTLHNIAGLGTIYHAQMDEDDIVLETQMDETLECEFPASSYTCLRNTEHPVLGGKNIGEKYERVQTAFEITSIKQLVNMLSPIWKTNFDSTITTYLGFSFSPAGEVYEPENNQARRNWWWQMCALFRYQRGGMRVSALANTFTTNIYSYALHDVNPGLAVNVVSEDFFSDAYDLTNIDEGFVFCPNVTFNTFDSILPYVSRFNCRLIQLNTNDYQVVEPEHDVDTGYYLATDQVLLANVDPSWTVIWTAAGADDYLMGFQLGIPTAIWV
jgi:hypothetical protein